MRQQDVAANGGPPRPNPNPENSNWAFMDLVPPSAPPSLPPPPIPTLPPPPIPTLPPPPIPTLPPPPIPTLPPPPPPNQSLPPALPPPPAPSQHQLPRQQHYNVDQQGARKPPPVPPRAPPPPPLRTQDSTVSSDSYSQTSSPSYKNMEAPLLPPTPRATKAPRQLGGSGGGSGGGGGVGGGRSGASGGREGTGVGGPGTGQGSESSAESASSGGALIKSNSTPASLQTVVKITGSNMSLHHRIIRDMRRPSTARHLDRERLRFRLAQLFFNAVALLAIGGGLAAYLKSYPSNIRYVNKTVTTTITFVAEEGNPAPGVCLPVIVPLCHKHGVPYNFTMYPNYMGHFTQRDAQHELEIYDAVVDVRCYELAALFLCSLFVPKCGSQGQLVRPCSSLCTETWWRCGFFMEVFGLGFPEYLSCDMFPNSPDPDICIGHREVLDAKLRARKPVCKEGFECDRHRCIPADWRCDGHVDCEDQSDELKCKGCPEGMIHCGKKRCIQQSHMCDGIVDCPWGQDERNCLRLSEKMGDVARGRLEVFHPTRQTWQPACVTHWDPENSAGAVCRLLGYTVANHSRLASGLNNRELRPGSSSSVGGMGKSSAFGLGLSADMGLGRGVGIGPGEGLQTGWGREEVRTVGSQLQQSQLLKEVRNCPGGPFPSVELSCRDYACGRRRLAERPRHGSRQSSRIVGGVEAAPGDWPFLAALLGGPEQVFYCAGVLIADQWVLSASHCVGNQSDPSGWTVQLGMTRRHAHSYFGQKVKVRRVVPHPLHNKGTTHNNDVALFQLQNKVTFHEHLLPVCLPRPDHDLEPHTVCTVIGWGKREDRDMDYEPAVNEVSVPVLTRDLCNAWLEENDVNVTESMICAGYPEGGKDACQGDSGGPLLCRDPQREGAWFVGGIVSWGIKCAHPHLPGVYAYVPRFVPWIREQMKLYAD